ncbi:MAG: hypothetical protein KDA61_17790 [Planctomycetales bacterium]|nr:hypothetical protein [Planctomycetales bacterium]
MTLAALISPAQNLRVRRNHARDSLQTILQTLGVLLLTVGIALADDSPASDDAQAEATQSEAAQTEANPSKETPTSYKLSYKFNRGDVLRYRVRHSANVRTTIDAETQQVESESESVKAWKVTDVLPDGSMEFLHLVESVKMSNQSGGGKVNRYDSSAGGEAPAGFEQAASAVGVPLTVTRIDATGKILHREEKHPQPPPAEDMPITLQLPADAVAVGEKWDRVYDVDAEQKSGAKLKVRTRRVCRLASVEDGIAAIDVEYQILTPVDSYVRSQLVERLTKGVVKFDLERGCVVSQQHDVDARILGFASQASSMQFVARTQEQLLPAEAVARRDEADASR